jgi:hypothetical protein
MRRVLVGLMALVVMSAAIGLASVPAAALTATIPAGNALTVTITVGADATISYSWTSDGGTLSFELRDQAANVLRSSSGTYGTGLYTVDHGGVYSLVWTNSNTAAVTINYNVDALDIGGGFFDDLGDAIVLGMIIVLAVIVIIVVVVVLVVVKGKKKQPQPATGPGAGVVPPMGNNCSVCGSPLDPSMAFCAKCGAKLR